MSSKTTSDDDAPTAPPTNDDTGGIFLDFVPFECLYQRLVAYGCSIIELAAGHYGRSVVEAVLRSLPLYNALTGDELEDFERRVKACDLSLLDNSVDGFDWQEIAGEFCLLFGFARRGEGTRRDPAESRADIERLLQKFQRLVDDPGVSASVGDDFMWFSDTLAAAEARWTLDSGLPVTPQSLAALAGVKPKTLANLIAAGQLAIDTDGRVAPAQALQYLDRRKYFVRSTWQNPEPAHVPNNQPAPPTLQEQVFVPVDSDGSPFLPSLARRSRNGAARYIIGEKAAPIYIEDYWDALAQLARMSTPRWRRPAPGSSGGWGLVSAQDGWRRFAKADLQRMVEAAQAQSA